MAWRWVLCLLAHLTLLFFLALYLVWSINSVRPYAPAAHAREIQLESLTMLPALLGAMDAERRTSPSTPRCARPWKATSLP